MRIKRKTTILLGIVTVAFVLALLSVAIWGSKHIPSIFCVDGVIEPADVLKFLTTPISLAGTVILTYSMYRFRRRVENDPLLISFSYSVFTKNTLNEDKGVLHLWDKNIVRTVNNLDKSFVKANRLIELHENYYQGFFLKISALYSSPVRTWRFRVKKFYLKINNKQNYKFIHRKNKKFSVGLVTNVGDDKTCVLNICLHCNRGTDLFDIITDFESACTIKCTIMFSTVSDFIYSYCIRPIKRNYIEGGMIVWK